MKNRLIILILSMLFTFIRLYAQETEWTLEKCIGYAEAHNKQLLSQMQKINVSELGLKNSKSKLIPEIEATAGLDYYWEIPVQVFPGELIGQPAGSHIPVKLGTPFMGNIGIQANWTVLDPSLFQEIKEKELQAQVSKYKLQSTTQSLIRNVRMAYYQSILKHKQAETIEKQLENYNAIHQLILQKFKKGLTDKITVNQSKNILNSINQNLTNVKLAHQKALLSLKFWMGYPMKDAIHINSNPNLDKNQIVTISFSAKSLPDYQLQQSKVLFAKQKLKHIHSQLYPSVSVQAGYSRLGFGNELNFITDSHWFPSGFVGLKLSIPLFSFSNHIYQPKKQKALIKAKEIDFQQYQEKAKKEFIQEKLALSAALSKRNTQKEQIQLAKENLQLTRQKIQKGIIDMITLKQILQDLNKAQENLYAAKLEAMQHQITLAYLQQNNSK